MLNILTYYILSNAIRESREKGVGHGSLTPSALSSMGAHGFACNDVRPLSSRPCVSMKR